jgi:predicted CopG family antitoxin
MPYKHVVKVSDRVYKALEELKALLGARSPNEVLEKLLVERDEGALRLIGVTPSTAHGVTPPTARGVTPPEAGEKAQTPLKVRLEMLSGHPWGFWRVIVGEGYDAVAFSLPRSVLEAMCRKKLLHTDICEGLHEALVK